MSREIDALVAEKVFGEGPETIWICTDDDGDSCRFSSRDRSVVEKFMADFANGAALGCTLGSWRHPRLKYSTDPAASKLLRDRMRELGFEFEITALQGLYCVRFDRDILADSYDGKAVLADTEELAVALAALAAFGIEAPTE